MQVALASGTDGDELYPMTQKLTSVIAAYKSAAGSVKSLLPKAKGKANPKGKAKAKAAASQPDN